ncbi:unnamed protein product [Protopolystoma xenopodis]|uniref:Uncharacterized protein n=1 Tax=Protopolystoma xenopodis TaxID=117903 RepID=A0A3S5AWR7_9PLAT|nr:unnamed protein product [Protopolystoma xenopodis]
MRRYRHAAENSTVWIWREPAGVGTGSYVHEEDIIHTTSSSSARDRTKMGSSPGNTGHVWDARESSDSLKPFTLVYSPSSR